MKFVYHELPEDGAFISAQIERNEVVYSVVLDDAGNPLTREEDFAKRPNWIAIVNIKVLPKVVMAIQKHLIA